MRGFLSALPCLLLVPVAAAGPDLPLIEVTLACGALGGCPDLPDAPSCQAGTRCPVPCHQGSPCPDVVPCGPGEGCPLHCQVSSVPGDATNAYAIFLHCITPHP